MKDKTGTNNKAKNLSDLVPDNKNANKGSQRGRGLLEKSLRQFGAGRSLLIDKNNNVLAGNKTLEIAAELDLKIKTVETDGTELVVVKRTDLDIDSEAGRGLAIADNRTSEMGLEWDTDILLQLSDDVDLTEFWKSDELDKLAKGWRDTPDADNVPSIDKADELRKKWGVELGQSWRLGEHKIICGDCTDADVVARLMDGGVADIEIHDPPYGMKLNTNWSSANSNNAFSQEKHLFGGNKYDAVIGDDNDFNPTHLFDRDLPKEMFLWGADYYAERIPNRLNGSLLVWDKRLNESADKIYGSCFEICWSLKKHKQDMLRVRWSGVFGVEKEPERKRSHPTQKPVALYELMLNKYSNTNDVVGDWYIGAGSHLIACERLGRKCRAIDIEPKYVAVTLERWATYTGEQPEQHE